MLLGDAQCSFDRCIGIDPAGLRLKYPNASLHAESRIDRLDLAIEEAVKSTPPKMCAVIEALQALRGIAQVAALTIVTELGEISRFPGARQLMGYGGIVASEHSSGENTLRGGHHQNGKCTLTARSWGGSLGIPSPTKRR